MVYNLNDMRDMSHCATWRKKINNLFGCNLSDSDIHSIFEENNIPKYSKIINGHRIIYYKKSDVEVILYNGKLKNEINNIRTFRNTPTPEKIQTYAPLKPSKNLTAQFSGINISKKDDDSDGLVYKNHENDMEKYSDYLINNNYMYENKSDMPTHKVKGGYKLGKSGKVYPTKKQADKQGQAIYASGWKNVNENKFYITESELIKIIKENINKIIKGGL